MSAIRDNKRKNIFNHEDEPPDKKLISDGDLLIKELHVKQKNTKINLSEELNKPSPFEKAATYVPITNFTSGTCDLQMFKEASHQIEQVEQLKRAGLTDEDIHIYLKSKNSEENLLKIHKNIEPHMLKDRLENIHNTIKNFETAEVAESNSNNMANRQHTESALSIKPDSIETKLLKFALSTKKHNELKLPHPMDQIKQIEKDFNNRIINTAPVDIKKIRKKARSLANKLKPPPDNDCSEKNTDESKWDVKNSTNEQPTIKEPKIYTCKQQNLYTVCNGEIIKLTPNEITNSLINDTKEKLSIEQIKKLPRFNNYTTGTPNKTLFLKNLPRNVNEGHLKLFFQKVAVVNYTSLRLMRGKMKGQAFITFDDEEKATSALKIINGEYVGNKPVIVQYARSEEKHK